MKVICITLESTTNKPRIGLLSANGQQKVYVHHIKNEARRTDGTHLTDK
jgi:hypothetical protein